MSRLEGKVAIVTGAAGGLGSAIGRTLAGEGAAVVGTDLRGGEGVVAHDVSLVADWTRVVERTEAEHGPVSVLVNNAGILTPGGVEQVTEADARKIFEVNQLGTLLGMQAVIGSMRRAGSGSIVNISSGAGMVGVPSGIAYAAAKWAVRGMTRCAAIDLAPDAIRVNSVHPSFIDTPMLGELPPEAIAALTATQLIQRLARPEEVAALVLFLASDEASFVTGSEHAVDGGFITG